MTKRSTLGGGTLLALALLFIGLTVLFNYALRGWRLDLTQNHLYTTAPGTDRILKSIKEPINLYFFFSEKTADQIPQLKTYGVRVREFLEELQARSERQRATCTSSIRSRSRKTRTAPPSSACAARRWAPPGSSFYFGLAGTNSTDGHAAIEFFDPAKEQFLEYDVVKLIYTLANPKKPVVAWLSTINMGESFDQRTGPDAAGLGVVRAGGAAVRRPHRRADREQRSTPTSTRSSSCIRRACLPPPSGRSTSTRCAAATSWCSSIRSRKPITAGADPQNPMAAMGADKSSHFNTLLSTWGVNFDPKQVVADRAHALSVSHAPGRGPVQHLGILGLDSSVVQQERRHHAPDSRLSTSPPPAS